MSLLAGDGFGHYATAQIGLKWDSGVSQHEIIQNGGRNNNPRLRLTFPFGTGFAKRAVNGSPTVLIAGVRIRPETLDSALLGFRNFTTNSTHVALVLNGASRIVVKTGGVNGTVIGTATTAIPLNQYTYIEVRVDISTTVGRVEIRLNGSTVPELLLTNVNTQIGASAIINQFYLGADFTYGGATSYNDFYLCDTSGTVNNTFLGDIRIDTLIPNGDGFYQDFSPSSGSQHHLLIDEQTPSIADFLSSATTGQKETVFLTDIGPVTSIKAVQINNYVNKSDTGVGSARNLLRTNNTDYTGTSTALATDPFYLYSIFETNPNTTTAWTQTDINSLQIGLENVS